MQCRPLLLAVCLAFAGCQGLPVKLGGEDPTGDDTATVLRDAEAAYAAKDWAAAEAAYRSLTNRMPGEAEPWFRLGNVQARLGQPDAAVSAWREALLRDPQLHKAWFNMGVVQLRQAANSFQKLRSYSEPGSAADAQAERLYGGIVELLGREPDSEP